MAVKLHAVGTTPADRARASRAQAREETSAAVNAALSSIEAMVAEIDDLVGLDHDKAGIPQAFERLRRHLVAEGAQVKGLRDRV